VRVPGNGRRALVETLAVGVIAGVPYSRLDPHAGLDDVLLLAATETTPLKTSLRSPQALTKEGRLMSSMNTVGRPDAPRTLPPTALASPP
jgi:hypothetical protein